MRRILLWLFLLSGGFILTSGFARAQVFFIGDFCGYISQVYSFGTLAAGGLSMASILVGSVFYMASGGNPQRVQLAKDIITGAIVGLILVLTSWLIFRAIAPGLTVCRGPQGSLNISSQGGSGSGTGRSFGSAQVSPAATNSTQGCGNAQDSVAAARSAVGSCFSGNHCAFLVSWALRKSGCGQTTSPNVSTFESQLEKEGYKKVQIKQTTSGKIDPTAAQNDIKAGDIVIMTSPKTGRGQHAMLSVGNGKVIHSVTGWSSQCKGFNSISRVSRTSRTQNVPECQTKGEQVDPFFKGHGPTGFADNVQSRFTSNKTKNQCVAETKILGWQAESRVKYVWRKQ